MGSYKLPPKVKLILGILGPDPEFLKHVRLKLAQKFGSEEEIMDPIPFVWTRYYARELGEAPWRCFISYQDLIPRESLVDIKRWTNQLEGELSGNGPRRVNLDPGYMTLGQFFLATTKDQRHRVYVRDGIFVEPTLYFQEGAFLPFEWTYPDYRSEAYLAYFSAARSKLAYQLRHGGMAYSLRKKAGKAETPGIGDTGSPGLPHSGD